MKKKVTLSNLSFQNRLPWVITWTIDKYRSRETGKKTTRIVQVRDDVVWTE